MSRSQTESHLNMCCGLKLINAYLEIISILFQISLNVFGKGGDLDVYFCITVGIVSTNRIKANRRETVNRFTKSNS